MANRLKCYAKAFVASEINFTVASEGQKSNSPERMAIFEGHDVWLWRKPYFWDRIPVFNLFFAGVARWKLYAHLFRNQEIDVIFSAGYRWPQMIVFALIARLSGKKYVLELNEVPHSIIVSRYQTKATNQLKKWITLHFAFPLIDGFIVISNNLDSLAMAHANQKAKTIKIPILTDSVVPKTDYSLKKELTIFHAGSLTIDKDGIVTVFESVAKAITQSGMNIQFALSNYQTLPGIKSQIESIMDRYGIRDNVTFFNYLSKEELEVQYRNASLVIINKPDNYRNRYNFSTKLGECMSYGLPIIATSVGESANYLQDGENCLLLQSSEDAEELSAKILRIVQDPQLAQLLGEGAKNTADRYFHYSNYKETFNDFFRNL
ncbi:glycosyltransferase family 4 protein [Flagellimonas marinaquae]